MPGANFSCVLSGGHCHFLDLGKENNEVDRFLVNLDVRIVVIYVRKVIPILI